MIESLYYKGLYQAAAGAFEKAAAAADELKEAMDKSPAEENPRQYYSLLGRIEHLKGNYAKAADFFEKIETELETNINHSLIGIDDFAAEAFYMAGRLEEARERYDGMLALTVGRLFGGHLHTKSHYMLGKICERQGDKTKAIENYKKFLDLWKDADPGFAEVDDAKTRIAELKKQ